MTSLSPVNLLSLPPATRSLLGTLALVSSFLFLLKLSSIDPSLRSNPSVWSSSSNSLAYPWVVVVPAKVFRNPWSLLLAGFAETSFVELVVSLLSLPFAGRYLERVWGQAEFLKFVFVVLAASNTIAVLVNYIESYLIPGGADIFLHKMSYNGMMGLQVGFLVAFTQLIPEHQVQIFGGLLKVRVKSLPMAYVTLSNIACILGYQSPYILIQFGWFASWYYLRFIKMSGESGEGGTPVRGDRSETFSFASWFPSFLQKYIRVVTTLLFKISVSIGLLRAWTDIESSSAGASFPSSPSGGHVLGSSTSSFGGGANNSQGARAEAERRRAMALKALDQRMASKPSSQHVPSTSTSTPPPQNPSVVITTHSTPSSSETILVEQR